VLYLRTDLDLRHRPIAAGGSVAHTEGVVDALERRGLEVVPWLTGDVGTVGERRGWRRLPVLAPANLPEELAALVSGLLQGLLPLGAAADASMVYQRAGLNGLAGVLLARRLDVPLVTEFNLSEGELRARFGRLRHRRLSRACDRAVLRRSHLVSVVSEGVAQEASELGALPERVLVLPNAVDVEPFADARPTALPWPDDPFVVAFSGLFYPWHGAVHLAEAFARLHAERPDARLLLVGDGVDRARADAVLERAGVDAAVHRTGLVGRAAVPGLLAAADVLCSPHADWPGFPGSPVKIFEYMASGRAIVASRLGQIGELLRHRETGLLVEPGDVDGLAAALRELRDDPELRGALGRAAQEEARRLHSWDARIERLLRWRPPA
jgi:glycosyltransferase involved in cell wall biosynthesis